MDHSKNMNSSFYPFRRCSRFIATAGIAIIFAPAVFANLAIYPTFTANFVTDFGANATAAENAWTAAANQFSANFSDNITVNINVDAVAGTSVFGESSTSLYSTSYGNLRNLLSADSKTANDATALGAGGSVPVGNPTGGTWWMTRAQAKAIGFIASDATTDGTTTFGAGNSFTFSGPIAPGTYDFTGVALHEISEVLGRLGISGGTIGSTPNSYSVIDLFSYTGAGVRGPGDGAGNYFSINNGTTLVKLFNDAAANGLDSRDWAPGSNDAFNQFSNSGVVNGLSSTDLQLMDVLGYDLVAVPEPGTGMLLAAGLAIGLGLRRRVMR